VPLLDGPCFYSVASLIGHGAFACQTLPSLGGTGVVDFEARRVRESDGRTGPVSGSYNFNASVCGGTVGSAVSPCGMADVGRYPGQLGHRRT